MHCSFTILYFFLNLRVCFESFILSEVKLINPYQLYWANLYSSGWKTDHSRLADVIITCLKCIKVYSYQLVACLL